MSEVVYGEDEGMMREVVVLGLLEEVGEEWGWEVWLRGEEKVSGEWVEGCGVGLRKVMEIREVGGWESVE